MAKFNFFSRLTAAGAELLDNTPLSIPLGFRKPKSITEQIAEFVANDRLREKLDAAGFETFEDAEDFEIGDDYVKLPDSKYEADFDNIKNGLALEREKARASSKKKMSKPDVSQKPKKAVKPPEEVEDESQVEQTEDEE